MALALENNGGSDDTVEAAMRKRSLQWYALYLRSRFEKRTHRELERRNIESFLPLIEEVRVWSDRKKKVMEPLFRGYVFVKTDLRNKVEILQADGVVRFVGVHKYPSPIPEEQINWIRIVLGYPEAVRREGYLSVSEKVRVIAGPFKGIQGIITRVKGSTRVLIALESIAQAVSVEVVPECLERVEDVVRDMS
jgi:transcription antitermination factor NusG